jgi:hypothetical protein
VGVSKKGFLLLSGLGICSDNTDRRFNLVQLHCTIFILCRKIGTDYRIIPEHLGLKYKFVWYKMFLLISKLHLKLRTLLYSALAFKNFFVHEFHKLAQINWEHL